MVHNFHPKICHPDRSEAQWRDLAFQPFASFPEPAEICAEFRGYHTSADRRPRDRRNPRAPGSRTSCAQTDHPPARRPDLDQSRLRDSNPRSRSSRPNHPAYLDLQSLGESHRFNPCQLRLRFSITAPAPDLGLASSFPARSDRAPDSHRQSRFRRTLASAANKLLLRLANFRAGQARALLRRKRRRHSLRKRNPPPSTA